MSDRLPGSSTSNPLVYRGWNIFPGAHEIHASLAVAFCHDDYDGADDANDERFGYAPSVEEAKRQIDVYEDQLVLAGAGGIK